MIMKKIKLTAFKKSGRYYSEFEVEIPDDTPVYTEHKAVLKAILEGQAPLEFVYYGEGSNEVPYLVNL